MIESIASPCKMTDSQLLGTAKAEGHEYWVAMLFKMVKLYLP